MFSTIKLAIICAASAILLALGESVEAQMMADITEVVRNDFGTYQPFPVEITPSCERYDIEPGFANVENFDRFVFTAREESVLSENGFVVIPGREGFYSGYWEIYDIYNECREKDIPIFITTDALLHTYHRLYDFILKIIEQEYLYRDLESMTEMALQQAEIHYQAASDSLVKEAAHRNLAYFSVAARLIFPSISLPAEAQELAMAELDLIFAQAGPVCSPVFEYFEDYSQYTPRGHYAQTDSLERYFRTMMWYGRMSCAVDEDIFGCLDWGDIRRQTVQALLMLRIFHDQPWAMALWEKIYQPTVFFVGRSDDLNLYQYDAVAQKVYEPGFYTLNIDSYGDEVALDDFIFEAQQLEGSRIDAEAPMGFRLMGQRFIADSYVLDRLVDPSVPGRMMPKGLDVMTVLGSERAYHILDEVYGETSWPNYPQQVDSLHHELAAQPDSLWAQNLYWNWLYCLMPFLFPKGEGYPFFMDNQAWSDRELNTALGSWTELRHDTILYSESDWCVGCMPRNGLVQGYVEPNPHLYARLASLVDLMANGLGQFAYWDNDFMWRLLDLKSLLLNLKSISEKELTSEPLTFEDYLLICNIGEILEMLVTFEEWYEEGPVWGVSLDQMPVVADVHTDAWAGACLEEGVGYPVSIYVIVEIEGLLKVTRGAVFSYYEFPHPIADRLTDEAWQSMLTDQNPPQLPVWTDSFRDSTRSMVNRKPQHYYWGHKGMSTLLLTLTPQSPMAGESIRLQVEVSDTLAQSPQIEIDRQDQEPIIMEIGPDTTTADVFDYLVEINTCGWNPGLIRTTTTGIFKGDWGAPTVTYHLAFDLQPGVGVDHHKDPESSPQQFHLFSCYPNPFNAHTVLTFFIPEKRPVPIALAIFNLLGQRVRILADGIVEPGTHTISWDGTDDAGEEVASGIYFCCLRSPAESMTAKLVLMR